MEEENTLILGGPDQAPAYARTLAAKYGDDLGLVLTSIALEHEKISGGRIEEERDYGGIVFQTFDEPVFIGSAIAQLQGYADAVVVDNLETWSERLCQRFPDNEIELDAEIASLVSVMNAHMSPLILIANPATEEQRNTPTGVLLQRIIARVETESHRVIDLGQGEPTARKGSLP